MQHPVVTTTTAAATATAILFFFFFFFFFLLILQLFGLSHNNKVIRVDVVVVVHTTLTTLH